MDLESIRVHAPSQVLFVCGGEADLEQPKPSSMRDAFLRFSQDAFGKTHTIITAEEIANYVIQLQPPNDLLTFESELAQTSQLIVLFSESFGSAAELGAFCTNKEISNRLLVFIDNVSFESNSFIKHGPLKVLMETHGEESVAVLNRDDLKIPSTGEISRLARCMDQAQFRSLVTSAISARTHMIQNSQSAREHTTFDRNRAGHIVKLIVGMIQHYGALTLTEVCIYLLHMGITADDNTILRYLLGAEFIEWITREKRGLKTYYIGKSNNEALQYNFLPTSPYSKKDRFRSDIAEHWKKTDANRFACITSSMKRATP